MEPKWGQDGAKTAKNSKKNIDPTKTTLPPFRAPSSGPKKWPTWPQLGSQNGAKNDKKAMQKSIKILVPLGVGFWNVFGGFWEAKWTQVGTKNAPKIDLNFGRPILQKKAVKLIEFNDLLGFDGRS